MTEEDKVRAVNKKNLASSSCCPAAELGPSMHIRSALSVQPRLRRPPASTRTRRCLQVLRRTSLPPSPSPRTCRCAPPPPHRFRGGCVLTMEFNASARKSSLVPSSSARSSFPPPPRSLASAPASPTPRSLARVGVVTGEGGRLTAAGAQAAAALAAHLHRRWRGDGEAHRMDASSYARRTDASSSGVGHAHRPSRPHATFPPALNGGSPERKWPAASTTGPVGDVGHGGPDCLF